MTAPASAPWVGGSVAVPAGRRPIGRAVRLLWAGQTVSLLGDQVTLLALPVVALAAGASVTEVAMLAAAGRAPFLVLTLPAGVWVRRIGLRRSMLVADLVRAAAVASVPLAGALATVTYPHLLAVAVVLGAAAALFQVAYQSLTPLLTDDPDQLRSANARLTGSEAVALSTGPASAGLLVAAVGAARALVVDAVSYLVSALTLAALRVPRDRPAPARSGPGLRGEMAAGARCVLASPPLRAILVSSVLFNTGFAGYEALLVVFAVHHLGVSVATLGLVLGLGGLGVPVGLLAARPLERRRGTGFVLLASGTLSGTGLVVTALATAVPMVALGTFVTAVGGGAWD